MSGPPMTETATAGLAPGTRLADYEIQRLLGEGSMGAVYLAKDVKLQRRVALKVIHGEVGQDPERRARFLREIRLTREVRDPGFVEVYDVGADDDRIFLAMEFVEGVTLEKTLQAARAALPLRETIRVGRELARALGVAHRAKIVHRDLNPENVQLASDGRVLILDFGLAKSLEAATPTDSTAEVLTRHGTVVGSPQYMSPEQARGHQLDGRSDIFTLGVLLFEMATGKKPFDAETWQDALLAVATQPAKRAGDHGAPPVLAAIIDKCLAKEPAGRYANCEELLAALEAIVLTDRKSIVEVDSDFDPLASTHAGGGAFDADEQEATELLAPQARQQLVNPIGRTLPIENAMAEAFGPGGPQPVRIRTNPPPALPATVLDAPAASPGGSSVPPPATHKTGPSAGASLVVVALVAVLASAFTAILMWFLLSRR